MKQNNLKFWNKKKVLITGHTGFKGGWLSSILYSLGSKVSGIALDPVGKKSFFNEVKVSSMLENDFRINIVDLRKFEKSVLKVKPEIIFHLAAQSSVIESFKNPHNTVTSNIIGTSNVLEIARKYKFIKSIVLITTDKVYQNYKEQKYFDENSKLGGDDIYSGSKACCELMIHSYRKSFFKKTNCKIASVRAGNCFGGGDWTPDRIVKDILECFYDSRKLTLRNPLATRPWQHVLEPLVGYLLLAEKLWSKSGHQYAQPWNFGPSTKQNMNVIDLARLFRNKMKSKSRISIKKNDKKFHNNKINIFESKHLNINSKKIFNKLNWKPKLSITAAVDFTIDWYDAFKKRDNLQKLTLKQIKQYLEIRN